MKQGLRSSFNTRQYMQEKDFEAFYYSDQHFETLPEHQHDCYEMYLFLEGDLSMEIHGTAQAMQPGDMVIVPPEVMHHALMYDSETTYRRFVLWLSREYMERTAESAEESVWLLQRAANEGHYHCHFQPVEFNAIQSRMLRLLEELHANRYGRGPAMHLALQDLLLYMNRTVYEREHPYRTDSGDLLQDLTLYIDGHLTEDLSLQKLADQFYLSKYYISHCFKDGLGIPIHQYVMKKRLQGCSEAIAAGGDIISVFADYGFQDYSAFYRAFKKEYGMSPREYQEMYKREAQAQASTPIPASDSKLILPSPETSTECP